MDYRKIYIKIIKNALSQNRSRKRVGSKYDNYYEKHHILPKSLFPLWTKRKSNLVLLTAREHFFCHQLLTKIYPGKSMAFALYLMCNGNKNSNHSTRYKITSKEYEDIKKLNSKYRKNITPWNKGKKTSKESIEKIRKSMSITISNMTKEERKEKFGHSRPGEKSSFYGKKHSLETKNKISQTKRERNRKLSKEERQKKYARDLRGAKNGRAHKVKLLNTGEIFSTIAEAKRKYPQAGHITECCTGRILHSGKLNGENMRWEYAS